jgi:hypothetical protein
MNNRTVALAFFGLFLACLYALLGWRYGAAFTAGYLFRPLWYGLVWNRWKGSDVDWQRHVRRNL